MTFTFDHSQDDLTKALGITEEEYTSIVRLAAGLLVDYRSKRIEFLTQFSIEELALFTDSLIQMSVEQQKDSLPKDDTPLTNLFNTI